jgi:hypothetical protein
MYGRNSNTTSEGLFTSRRNTRVRTCILHTVTVTAILCVILLVYQQIAWSAEYSSTSLLSPALSELWRAPDAVVRHDDPLHLSPKDDSSPTNLRAIKTHKLNEVRQDAAVKSKQAVVAVKPKVVDDLNGTVDANRKARPNVTLDPNVTSDLNVTVFSNITVDFDFGIVNHTVTRIAREIKRGNRTNLPKIPVYVWPYAEFGLQTAENAHIEEDGVNESPLLELTNDVYNLDPNLVWVGDPGSGTFGWSVLLAYQ